MSEKENITGMTADASKADILLTGTTETPSVIPDVSLADSDSQSPEDAISSSTQEDDADESPVSEKSDKLKRRIKARSKSLKSRWNTFKDILFSRILHLNRIDRYLMWKFLSTYIFVIVIIISIAVVFDVNENIDKFVSRNATVHQIIFDYYVNFVPYYSNLFSQLFVFVSVIYFTTKLAENPFKKRRTPAYTTNVQLEVDKGVIAYIGRYEDNTKTGYEFFLDKFKNKKLVSHLQSSTIRYDSLAEEPYHWILSNYQIRDIEGMREVLSSGTRLDTIIKMEPQDFLITKGQQETLTSPKLRKYIKRQKERGFANIKEFEFEYWKRGASSFAIIILTVMGASLSARKRKNGMGIALGIGIFLSLLYILFQTFSKTFAVNLNMHAALAAWIPNILFAFIAFILYKKAPR